MEKMSSRRNSAEIPAHAQRTFALGYFPGGQLTLGKCVNPAEESKIYVGLG